MSDPQKTRDELQHELNRTRQLLNLVLENGQMTGAIVDTDLRHTWVYNPAPEPTEEAILGRTDEELFPSEIAQPTTEIKRAAIETGERIEREFSFIKPWGVHWYRGASEPTRDMEGHITGAMFAALDRSDRFRLLERTSDAVFTLDQQWRITSWNTPMVQRTGIEARQVVGRSLWTVSQDLLDDSLPPELEAQYRRAMETGESIEFQQHIPEPFDYWVEIRLFPDENGLSVFSRDITDQIRRTRQLERQEFLFQRAQELSSMGIWELDPHTETLWWSSGVREIHGVDAGYTPTLDEAIEFYHPDDQAAIETVVRQAIESGEGYEQHLRIIRPDDEVRHVLARGESVTDDEGNVRLLRGTFQDVTELERTKRQLRAQNERLDRFADVVAHDIRSPLNVAMGFANLAQETGDLTHLDRVQTAQQRIAELVHDLMLLARTSKHAAEKSPVSLTDIAQRAWANVATGALTLDVNSALPTVEGHAGLLTELFENLYRNAVEHSSTGITVRVGPLEANGFYVEDTGPGIPPDQWEHVFQHGYSTNDEGTGLGLSIVTEIATAHGWMPTVGYSSEGGARFEFRSQSQ